MNHSDLIDRLAADAAPVDSLSGRRATGRALGGGAAAAIVAVAALYGIQPGLETFSHGAPFLMKSAYGVALGGVAFGLLIAAARPGRLPSGAWRAVGIPVAALALLALIQIGQAPVAAWPSLIFGKSWSACPFRVLAVSIPIYLGLCLAIRREAPTDLRAAGAAAGLLSGAAAATIYALACTESSAAFVLLWYSLGIVMSTIAGALTGPTFLRWSV